jgi:hypothetical protein
MPSWLKVKDLPRLIFKKLTNTPLYGNFQNRQIAHVFEDDNRWRIQISLR